MRFYRSDLLIYFLATVLVVVISETTLGGSLHVNSDPQKYRKPEVVKNDWVIENQKIKGSDLNQ